MNQPMNHLQLAGAVFLVHFLCGASVAWSQSCEICASGTITPSYTRIPIHTLEAKTNLKDYNMALYRFEYQLPSQKRLPQRFETSQRFETYTLMLLPDEQWVQSNGDGMAALKTIYEHFGHAIGNVHLAVWFAGNEAGGGVDTNRAKGFCSKFGCQDEIGPHLILTKVNPDAWQRGRDEMVKISFKGIRAERASVLLSVLEQDLLKYQREKPLPDRVKWVKVFEVLRESIEWRKLDNDISLVSQARDQ